MDSRRVAIYARVSTDGQTADNQLREVREVATRAGWTVTEEFVDHGISGAKGRDQRPAFDRLLKAAARREFDLIATWSVDRLGRSLQDLLHTLADLHSAGCDLYLHRQAIDTRTPSGRAMFQMLGVFAEFERAMIQERVRAGIARARAAGKRIGRPRVGAETEARVRTLRARGKGMLSIARALGIGAGTVQRVINER